MVRWNDKRSVGRDEIPTERELPQQNETFQCSGIFWPKRNFYSTNINSTPQTKEKYIDAIQSVRIQNNWQFFSEKDLTVLR